MNSTMPDFVRAMRIVGVVIACISTVWFVAMLLTPSYDPVRGFGIWFIWILVSTAMLRVTMGVRKTYVNESVADAILGKEALVGILCGIFVSMSIIFGVFYLLTPSLDRGSIAGAVAVVSLLGIVGYQFGRQYFKLCDRIIRARLVDARKTD